MAALRQWWCEKFRLPWTSREFQESTEFELEVAYWEDHFRANPDEIIDEYRDEHGNIVLPSTGDKLLDRFEAQLARGEAPDLEEGLSKEQRGALQRERERAKRIEKLEGEVLGNLEDADWGRVGRIMRDQLLGEGKDG